MLPACGVSPGPLPLPVDVTVVGTLAIMGQLHAGDARLHQPVGIERGQHARNRRLHLAGSCALVVRHFLHRPGARLVDGEAIRPSRVGMELDLDRAHTTVEPVPRKRLFHERRHFVAFGIEDAHAPRIGDDARRERDPQGHQFAIAEPGMVRRQADRLRRQVHGHLQRDGRGRDRRLGLLHLASTACVTPSEQPASAGTSIQQARAGSRGDRREGRTVASSILVSWRAFSVGTASDGCGHPLPPACRKAAL